MTLKVRVILNVEDNDDAIEFDEQVSKIIKNGLKHEGSDFLANTVVSYEEDALDPFKPGEE